MPGELRGKQPRGKPPDNMIFDGADNLQDRIKKARRYRNMFVKVVWSPSLRPRDELISHGQVAYVGTDDTHPIPTLILSRWMPVAKKWRYIGKSIGIPVHTIGMIEIWHPGVESIGTPPGRPVL